MPSLIVLPDVVSWSFLGPNLVLSLVTLVVGEGLSSSTQNIGLLDVINGRESCCCDFMVHYDSFDSIHMLISFGYYLVFFNILRDKKSRDCILV